MQKLSSPVNIVSKFYCTRVRASVWYKYINRIMLGVQIGYGAPFQMVVSPSGSPLPMNSYGSLRLQVNTQPSAQSGKLLSSSLKISSFAPVHQSLSNLRIFTSCVVHSFCIPSLNLRLRTCAAAVQTHCDTFQWSSQQVRSASTRNAKRRTQ